MDDDFYLDIMDEAFAEDEYEQEICPTHGDDCPGGMYCRWADPGPWDDDPSVLSAYFESILDCE